MRYWKRFVVWSAALMAMASYGCGDDGRQIAEMPNEEDMDVLPFPGDKADSITPSSELGYFIVELPEEFDGEIPLLPFTLKYRHTRIELGQKYGLRKGTGCIQIETDHDQFTNRVREQRVCEIEIVPGQTTSYTLSVIVADWDSSLYKVDVGPKAILKTYLYEVDLVEESGPLGLVFLNKKFHTGVDPNSLEETHVWELGENPGKVHALELDREDKRGIVKVKAPVREADSPLIGRGREVNAHVIKYSNRYSPGVGFTVSCETNAWRNFVHFALDEEQTFLMFPVPRNVESRYIYTVNYTSYPFNVESGETTVIEGQHIDVFDAEVIAGDGSVLAYPARYSVKQLIDGYSHWAKLPHYGDCSGRWNTTIFDTPSGIDLAPGVYRIDVDFNVEGGNRFSREYRCNLVTPSVPGEERCSLVSSTDY